MVDAFNLSTWNAEAGRSLECETSLLYRVSSRMARTTQRNPVLKKKKNKNKTITKEIKESFKMQFHWLQPWL